MKRAPNDPISIPNEIAQLGGQRWTPIPRSRGEYCMPILSEIVMAQIEGIERHFPEIADEAKLSEADR